jgi:hypothetical protein
MSVDFSHSGASWAYSGFHRFRTTIAKCVGIELGRMQGFQRLDEEPRTDILQWDEISQGEDPICILLNCEVDGIIKAEYCERVGNRLAQILFEYDKEFCEYDRRNGLMLVGGLLVASTRKEDLEFR